MYNFQKLGGLIKKISFWLNSGFVVLPPHCIVHQAPSPSLPWPLWATISAAGTTTTRKMCSLWMQALTSMTFPMTSSGLTLSMQMGSATSPGIHTSSQHQRKCYRVSWTRDARYRLNNPADNNHGFSCQQMTLHNQDFLLNFLFSHCFIDGGHCGPSYQNRQQLQDP